MKNDEYFVLSSQVLRGIELINHGEFFEAHEILEAAWRAETREVRHLLQGLVQVSVMLYHLERGNQRGAFKLAKRALANLQPFKDLPSRLDIPRLIEDILFMESRLQATNNSDGNLPSVNQILVRLKDSPPGGD